MKKFNILILSLALLLPIAGCNASSSLGGYERHAKNLSQTSVLLEIETTQGVGHCSGTAVSPTVILTASHCFLAPLVKLKMNGEEVTATHSVDDGADHLFIVFDSPKFKKWARLDFRALRQGEEIAVYGNPGVWRNLFRVGVVAGDDNHLPPVEGSQLIDVQIFGGDSGSGVFDKNGKLVSVISYSKNQINPRSFAQIAFAGVLPIKFTKEQLKEVGL